MLERLAGMDKMPDEIKQMIPNPITFFNAVKNMTRDQINELSSQFLKFIADNHWKGSWFGQNRNVSE